MITVDITVRRNSFDVSVHEIFDDGITGIFGPSGSGKTTILNTIAGLIAPDQGAIAVNDRVFFNAEAKIRIPPHKRRVGYVFQEGRLFPHMTVLKNLHYGMSSKTPPQIGFDTVVDLLKLTHLLGKKPGMISGGERQRVALGRALLSAPELLLLDEPFSAVDTSLRSRILPFLHEIHQKVKIPMLVVSHELPDLLKLTDRLCVIKGGRCVGHDDYPALLASETSKEMFGTGSVLNTVTMNVDSTDPAGGITILTTPEGKNSVRVVCEKTRRQYLPGQMVKVFVNSHDIALSSRCLDEVTIQNQLEGTVVDLIERDSTIFCIVDVGFTLIVEITAESGRRLAIRNGSRIWCLFKSVAIDVAG